MTQAEKDNFKREFNKILNDAYHSTLLLEEASKKNTSRRLSFRDRNALEFLLEKEDGYSISRLADYLKLTRPSATEMIKKLEKLELVERYKNPQWKDERKKCVRITRKGRLICAIQRQYRNGLAEEILKDLTEEESQAFYKGLAALNECFIKAGKELEHRKKK